MIAECKFRKDDEGNYWYCQAVECGVAWGKTAEKAMQNFWEAFGSCPVLIYTR